jgi:hypothetical protein
MDLNVKKKSVLRLVVFLFGLSLFFYGVFGLKDRFANKKPELPMKQNLD